MKKSTKITSIIIIFFLVIAIVIIGRAMIGNHFKKKFSKRPPPGIIVTEVLEKEFSEQIETYGTAISQKSKTFKIKKDDLFETAVPNVSIFSENSCFFTSVTIIPGGGCLLNFFLK